MSNGCLLQMPIDCRVTYQFVISVSCRTVISFKQRLSVQLRTFIAYIPLHLLFILHLTYLALRRFRDTVKEFIIMEGTPEITLFVRCLMHPGPSLQVERMIDILDTKDIIFVAATYMDGTSSDVRHTRWCASTIVVGNVRLLRIHQLVTGRQTRPTRLPVRPFRDANPPTPYSAHYAYCSVVGLHSHVADMRR